jgi:hypothetical protein
MDPPILSQIGMVWLCGGCETTFEGNGSLCGIPTVYCARILLRMLVGLPPHEILSVSSLFEIHVIDCTVLYLLSY